MRAREKKRERKRRREREKRGERENGRAPPAPARVSSFSTFFPRGF